MSVYYIDAGGLVPTPGPTPSPTYSTPSPSIPISTAAPVTGLEYLYQGCYADRKDRRIMRAKKVKNTMSAEVGGVVEHVSIMRPFL